MPIGLFFFKVTNKVI